MSFSSNHIKTRALHRHRRDLGSRPRFFRYDLTSANRCEDHILKICLNVLTSYLQICFFSLALLGSITFAIEIVYILDSSDTVTLDQYKDEKAFVLYLARYLKMVPSHSRNAVISYGSSATVVTDLGQADTIQAFDLAVNNASKIGGQRRMDRAIDTARTVLSNARAAIPKVVILLTTGSQPRGIKAGVLESSMQRLYEMGARLYAVTINAPTVNLPLKNTDGSDWFPVRSFMDLPIQVLPLARHIASDTGMYCFSYSYIPHLPMLVAIVPWARADW